MSRTRSGGILWILAVTLGTRVLASDKLYLPGSLILPMDTTYQDDGMLAAYGLVYDLLRNDIPVDWVIAPGKAYGGVDFHAVVTDVQSSLFVGDHGYRGGPFVVGSEHRAAALPIVEAWQNDHPGVSVHSAELPFTTPVARELIQAPTIAVYVDGGEDVAFAYLNAAGIPMRDGSPWPASKDPRGKYPCPGFLCCPDCLDERETGGPTSASHSDGALFDANGVPRICQFLAMHRGKPVKVAETVAEVRAFLAYPVHLFAEGRAVENFENDVNGRFLSTNGIEMINARGELAHFHDDDPFAQADGPIARADGQDAAYTLARGSSYHDENVVMLAAQGARIGLADVWMNGRADNDPRRGKVSYLGGRGYGTELPISGHPGTQGTRYFLNSLFEAPCASAEGLPAPSTALRGPAATTVSTLSISACSANAGPGIAFDAVLSLNLPAGASLVSASGGGAPTGGGVAWDLGSLPAGASSCVTASVSLAAQGSYAFSSRLAYTVGMKSAQVESGPPLVVRFGSVHLLRYGGFTGLDPLSPAAGQVFAAAYPADPALDPARDLEQLAFAPAGAFPHEDSDLLPGAPPLVLYELEGFTGNTLRVAQSGGKIVVTY